VEEWWPKFVPATVIPKESDFPAFERPVELGFDASDEKNSVTLAMRDATVAMNFSLLKPPFHTLQCNVVYATHKDCSQAVCPILFLIDASCRPKPPPLIDNVADPVIALLAWNTSQTQAESTENPFVRLDERCPSVKINRLVFGFWAPAWQSVHESDIQLVRSHAVSPTLEKDEGNPVGIPKTVKTYDPLAAPFVLFIMLATLRSTEKQALKLPEGVPAEITKFWLVLNPRAVKQYSVDADIQ
jgi:hypothetical protein